MKFAAFLLSLPLLAQQIDYPTQIARLPAADPRTFVFTRTNGISASGNLAAAGAKTVILTKCPLGINGSDTFHNLYLSGGVGTAEPVLITGGTCVAGAASGTLTFTTVNTHTGSWKLTSVAGGIPEALQALLTAGIGGTVFVPTGTITVYAPISLPGCSGSASFADGKCYSLIGQGIKQSILSADSTYAPGGDGIITFRLLPTASHGMVANLKLTYPAPPDSTDYATYTHWPGAIDMHYGASYCVISDLDIINAWIGIDARANVGGCNFRNIHASGFSIGVAIGAGVIGDFVRLHNIYHGPHFTGTANNLSAFLANAVGFQLNGAAINATQLQGFDKLTLKVLSGSDFINIADLSCDGQSCMNVAGGRVSVMGGYSSIGTATDYWITQTGGNLSVSGMTVIGFSGQTVPLVSLTSSSGVNTFLKLSGNNIQSLADSTAISISNGTVIIEGNIFAAGGTTQPSIILAGAGNGRSATIVNNNFLPASPSNTLVAINMTTPGFSDTIANNTLNTALVSMPSVAFREFLGIDQGGVTLAQISGGSLTNGQTFYCTDCKNIRTDSAVAGAACVSGGSGTIARMQAGVWVCN